MARLPGIAALSAAAFLLCAQAFAEPPRATASHPSREALIRQFDDVVFGQEHGPTRQIIRKWRSMPTVAFFASPEADGLPPLATIRRHLDEISAATGLAFPKAPEPAQAALRVGFFPRRDFAALPMADGADPVEYERFVRTSACLGIASAAAAEPGALAVGAIMIGTDIDHGLQQHCILEELVQITGLANDACDYRPSLFCEDDHVMEMTAADRLLLRTLYDGRLVPGMSRAEAMPLVAVIIAEQLESF